jgi:hypothetical protein
MKRAAGATKCQVYKSSQIDAVLRIPGSVALTRGVQVGLCRLVLSMRLVRSRLLRSHQGGSGEVWPAGS